MPTLSPPAIKVRAPRTPPPVPPSTGGGAEGPTPPPAPKPKRRRGTDPKVLLVDWLMSGAIRIGGSIIVASVLGIFIFILATTLPLFRGAQGAALGEVALAKGQAPALAMLSDEHREKALIFHEDGGLSLAALQSGMPELQAPLKGWRGGRGTCSLVDPRAGRVLLGTEQGWVWEALVGFETRFDADGQRHMDPRLGSAQALQIDPLGKPLRALAASWGEDGRSLAGLSQDGRVLLLRQLGGAKGRPQSLVLDAALKGAASVYVSQDMSTLLVGGHSGLVQPFDLSGAEPAPQAPFTAFDTEAVTALGAPLGGQSLLVGGEQGSVQAWALLMQGEVKVWKRLHSFEAMPSGVRRFASSARDKGFVAADQQGLQRVYFLTSERSLVDLPSRLGAEPRALAMAPKSDGILRIDGQGRLESFSLDNPHPETTWRTLFGKVWYEGYEQPEYVWQSTGGSDDFEQKFSLTPLIYGTLKGSFFALLFAVPLALLAAIYTSQFMHPDLRKVAKPLIELMAALPSVVLGFLAALMLAPFMEKHLFGLVLGGLLVPLFALATLFAWRATPVPWQRRLGPEAEILVLLLGLLAGFSLVALAAPPLEQALFGDLKVWLMNTWGVRYDQRNSLVVGFAMGFAVIPIIYTICEDSLSSVPRHLISASLSAGATPWQTAIRVVLPVALSGIFSAVMVGFGRAVGETMIVLMATGNTPVMDPSPFNGFRALSANIAVEIPEAPVGGSLYRVLFLAGLLLFALTFVVNTVAELVRIHLRKKYSQL